MLPAAGATDCCRVPTRTRTRATSSTACARTSSLAPAFRLGDLTKPEVRDVARRHGLATAEKPESQEICFVPGGDYRTALRDRAGWTEQPGELLDADGAHVGQHAGAAAYTVGQRQGLGVALGEPRYVSAIDARANVVTLGRREDLYRREFEVEKVNFVAGEAPADVEFETNVRIRHRADPVPGVVAPRRRQLARDPRARRLGAGARPGGGFLRR